MRLTPEQVVQILDAAVENIMKHTGCTRDEAKKQVEENGVRVTLKLGDKEQTLLISIKDKKPTFTAND